MEVNHPAPTFTLTDDQGKTLSLSSFRGKKVILYFYPKDDTPGCTTQACAFRDNWTALAKLNTQVIGISKDSVKDHQAFKAKYQLPFILLADETGAVCQQYGVLVEKQQGDKKYLGIERSTFLIDEQGNIAAIWPNVNVDTHLAEIMKKLAH